MSVLFFPNIYLSRILYRNEQVVLYRLVQINQRKNANANIEKQSLLAKNGKMTPDNFLALETVLTGLTLIGKFSGHEDAMSLTDLWNTNLIKIYEYLLINLHIVGVSLSFFQILGVTQADFWKTLPNLDEFSRYRSSSYPRN